jgi:cytidyltransferase-like protein
MIIGLTTGVFDLFHKGHEILLKNCERECDFLLVAVANDWLTKVQKGDERPIEDETKRVFNVRNFLNEENINGEAFLTEHLNFNYYKEIVDIMLIGEEQTNILWTGNYKKIPRTPDISTTKLISEKNIGLKQDINPVDWR